MPNKKTKTQQLSHAEQQFKDKILDMSHDEKNVEVGTGYVSKSASAELKDFVNTLGLDSGDLNKIYTNLVKMYNEDHKKSL